MGGNISVNFIIILIAYRIYAIRTTLHIQHSKRQNTDLNIKTGIFIVLIKWDVKFKISAKQIGALGSYKTYYTFTLLFSAYYLILSILIICGRTKDY